MVLSKSAISIFFVVWAADAVYVKRLVAKTVSHGIGNAQHIRRNRILHRIIAEAVGGGQGGIASASVTSLSSCSVLLPGCAVMTRKSVSAAFVMCKNPI